MRKERRTEWGLFVILCGVWDIRHRLRQLKMRIEKLKIHIKRYFTFESIYLLQLWKQTTSRDSESRYFYFRCEFSRSSHLRCSIMLRYEGLFWWKLNFKRSPWQWRRERFLSLPINVQMWREVFVEFVLGLCTRRQNSLFTEGSQNFNELSWTAEPG